MNYNYRLFYLLGLLLVLISCKNEVKDSPQQTEMISVPEKKELNVEEKAQLNSILTKAMIRSELKTFVSTLVTTGITDMLSKQEGPFTIIAPSNAAFNKINNRKMDSLLNPVNKDRLKNLVNSHIIEGNLDTSTLVQNIKNGKGNYKIIALSGATYTVSRDGTNIIITDEKGAKATIGKSDIIGSNGILHILDEVLSTH